MTPEGRRTLTIVTPEGVPLALTIAGRWERALAFSLDVGLIVCAGLFLGLIGVLAGDLIVLSALFFLRNGYFILWELVGQGATPGKRALHLRVVARDGGALSTDRILARNMLREVELFLPLAALIAPEQLVGGSAPWLWMPALSWIALIALFPLFNREGARLGDLLAGTVVIELPRADLQADQALEAAPAEIHFSADQLSVYGEKELETLASILRATTLRKVPRAELRLVAETIARKVAYQGQAPSTRPLEFLRAFYRAQRASLEQRLLFGRRKASKQDRPG